MTLVVLLAAGIAFALWRIQATPDARPEPVPSTGPGRCREACSVASCAEPVATSIHAGHDYWPMCIGHGLPFLIEELS